MGIIRTTFFFELDRYGWSESYFKEGTLNQNFITSTAIPLANKRVKMLGKIGPASLTGAPWLKYMRCSDINVFGDSKVNYFNQVDGTNDTSGFGSCDMPWTRAKSRQEALANNTVRRFTYMGGFPDNCFVNGDEWIPTPGVLTKIQQFFTFLGNWSWGLVSKQPATGATVWQPTAVAYNATAKTVTLTGAPVPGGPDAKYIKISKVQHPKSLNGTYPLLFDSNGKAILTGFCGDPGIWDGTGKFLYIANVFYPLGYWAVEDATRRATGRPFDSPRGRRKSRSCQKCS